MTASKRSLDARALALLRRLSCQMDSLRQDLRLASAETTLLAAMEEARPLTAAELRRATYLRMEMWRIEQDLVRVRAEYARLHEHDARQNVHRRPPECGPYVAPTANVRAP